MKSAFKRFTLLLTACVACVAMCAAEPNNDVKKVLVIFKTHLDVGFTDYSSVVTKRYVEEFIPKL